MTILHTFQKRDFLSVMEMMQVLLAEGKTEEDHGALALFYEKLNGLSLKR